MQLVGIGFNPSFWRFLLQRIEKHTVHGPIIGTLLDGECLAPDHIVATCDQIEQLQPALLFFTPHGFKEGRDCLFFLSMLQTRLRDVPLTLVLEDVANEIRLFLQPPPLVRLTNQMQFRMSHPSLFLTQKLGSFPWINLSEHVTFLEYEHPQDGLQRLAVSELPDQSLLALAQVRFFEVNEQSHAPQEWLERFLAERGDVKSAHIKGLLKTTKGLFLFPGVPLDGVVEISMGDIRIRSVLLHRQLSDRSAAFRRTMAYLEKKSACPAPQKNQQRIRCLGSLPIVNELACSVLEAHGFGNAESVHQLQAGTHKFGETLRGFYLRTLPNVELSGNVVDLRSNIESLLAPVLDFVDWSRLQVPTTITSTPLQRADLEQRRAQLVQEERNLREEQKRTQSHQQLYAQEQDVLERVVATSQRLIEQLGKSSPWEDVARNPTEFSIQQALLWCEDEETAAEMMRRLASVPKKLWINPLQYRDSDDLLRLNMDSLEAYTQAGLWIVTPQSRQHLEQLVSSVFSQHQRVQAINKQRQQHLERTERALTQLQQRKEQLTLHWLYVSLQQALQPHFPN